MSAKNPIFALVWGITLPVLISTSLNFYISRTGVKSRIISNFGHIVYFSELLALEC